MDRLELEKVAKRILELRKKQYALKSSENELREKILNYFKEQGKERITVGDYIIEMKKKFFKNLKPDLSLPESYFQLKEAIQLHVKRKQDIELIGNKFVVKK